MVEYLADLIDKHSVDEVIENLVLVIREKSEENDEDEETSRQWRVRGNGLMQALRFYQNFVKERNA